ncbi:hypothetical protein PCASD_08506 [Puccinia coronata f. sp. avenae]|uniref:Uncharacterized protein n=2 Tax=Puccinia coronata f. sp. avenae TaxID=200324 RepID=A0A2N5UY53_9BASI|nr:hypothetical protein PCASD_08506 [Puccinia coronata f. sp. avenae]
MSAMNSTEEMFSKILMLSQSSSAPQATMNDLIFQRFSNPPVVPEDEEDEGIWYVVNKSMDSLFGTDNCKENIRSGKYGIEVVIAYLKQARKHPLWNADELLALKLERIYSCFEELGGVLVEEPLKKISVKVNLPPKKLSLEAKNSPKEVSPNAKKPAKKVSPTNNEKTPASSAEPFQLLKENSGFSTPIDNATKSHSLCTTLAKKILSKCPKSTKAQACKDCSISRHNDSPQDMIFKCHCGAPPVVLPKGRSQNVEAHWRSSKCTSFNSSTSNTRPIYTYFIPIISEKRRRDSDDLPVECAPRLKKQTIEVLCSGLNDATWKRPRSQKKIVQCIQGSPSTHHGAPPRHESSWYIKRHHATSGIFSSKCEKIVNVDPGVKDAVCQKCRDLKGDNSLIKALNVEYATSDTMKFIASGLMKRNLFQSKLIKFEELRQLHTSLEKHSKTGDDEFWTSLAIQAKRGLFKDMDAFRGLVKAVSIRASREASGKMLNGMRFDTYFDSFLTTMAAMSPAAANYFRDNFAGRSLRGMRYERKKNGGHIEDGIVMSNFETVAGYIKDLGYSGPLALASDQTVCVKSLRSHNGHLVGAQGGDISFNSLDEISELVKKITMNDQLCSKVRLYTIQVPLPKIPSFVVALVASYDKETAEDIAASHISVLEYCSKAGMSILSLGSDGAATEISALRMVQASADKYLSFHKSDAGVSVQVPLIGEPPQPVVAVQDPKHARKTATNQILSGARLLSFGKFHLNISHLVELLGDHSTLYNRDVLNCDKQDDGRAYRTMNWETLEASLRSPKHIGLSIYLFLLGELTDAWLCQKMNHLDRIRSSWTCIFFLRLWHLSNSDKNSPLTSIDRNGVSRQSFEIFSFLGNSLLGLIIAHRDFHPKVPLLPWKHGTEACEHIFGWMRVIMPNFTVLDARQMLPKIFAVVRNVMSGKMKMPKSEHLRSGYKYNFANELLPENYEHLAQFPTNIEITHELAVAESQARKIATFAGINSSYSLTKIPSLTQTPVKDEGNDTHESEGVSTSDSTKYDVTYACVPDETPISEMMHKAAIAMG